MIGSEDPKKLLHDFAKENNAPEQRQVTINILQMGLLTLAGQMLVSWVAIYKQV